MLSFHRPIVRLGRHSSSFSTAVAHSSNRTRWRLLVGGTGVAASLFVVQYFHDHFGGMEGLQRAISFYSLAIPKYIEYRWHQAYTKDESIWEELDRQTSRQGLTKILELKGFYIKCGQMAASNIGDAFPQIWQETMSVLQDRCPEEDFETVIRPIIESELDVESVFQSIDPKPIGSASIGQVHRAILKDGTPVVVKVCYPHVERLLRGDVRTIRAFCEIAQPVHVPSIKEVELQFKTEFDYRTEAQNLEAVRKNLLAAKLPCQVPKAYLDYCTKHVLVMEELYGEKLIDVLKRDVKKWQTITGMSVDELKQMDAPVDRVLRALEMQRRLHNVVAGLHNWTFGWVSKPMSIKQRNELPLDHAQLVDDLLYIHGHEVLVNGLFNADCHPGNILLSTKSDDTAILGLIDYGQTKSLTKDERILFGRLVIALDDDDKNEIVRLMKLAGFRSRRMDEDVIYRYAKVGYDQDNKELTNGLHIQMFMEELQNQDPVLELPKPFLMVSRASLLLRGLAHSLKQSRSVAKAWRPIAESVLKDEA